MYFLAVFILFRWRTLVNSVQSSNKGGEFYLATKLFPGYPVAAPLTRKSEPEPGNPESSPHLADVTYRSEQSLPPKATDVWKEKNDKTGFKPVFCIASIIVEPGATERIFPEKGQI